MPPLSTRRPKRIVLPLQKPMAPESLITLLNACNVEAPAALSKAPVANVVAVFCFIPTSHHTSKKPSQRRKFTIF
ncbi:hypothetical protein M7I_4580 [Glarea lozoyensis 74030]|uniref:Uncharacterized protein n=1 Tax=Glarea lozoyensis (strain ATCC 74030 / MF5533) TaxID=1104152 RepID=H0EPJ9_GLAL7|nr:hypothetical protein M7I_4580 [Glarea lozoyensis 74030]